jgi:hypothetical protein
LKLGLNVDLTEKILLMTMCRFCIESVEHPRANNNVAAHTTPLSVFAIDIGAIYRIDGVSLEPIRDEFQGCSADRGSARARHTQEHMAASSWQRSAAIAAEGPATRARAHTYTYLA